MNKLMMYEEMLLKRVKRGLCDAEEATNKYSGFVDAMVAFGIIEQDRASEEKEMFVEKVVTI